MDAVFKRNFSSSDACKSTNKCVQLAREGSDKVFLKNRNTFVFVERVYLN